MKAGISMLAGVALAAMTSATITAPALAYIPSSATNFVQMAGSVGAATERDSLLEPSAYALYSKIYGIKGISERDAAGITAFYGSRGYEPAWIADGKLTPAATAMLARMSKADEDGLDVKAFSFTAPDAAQGSDAASEADIRFSLMVVTYARQAQIGRVNPSSIDENIAYEPVAPNPAEVLAALHAAADPAAALDAYNPPHEGFKRLRSKLAELRDNPTPVLPAIAAGPTLKSGMKDKRVPALRARFELPAEVEAPEVYDAAVIDAVKAFQKREGLGSDGNLGPATLAAINRTNVDRIGEVVANMERWRWMPRDLTRFHVFVDVPGFMVHVVRDGKPFYSTRIIVGRPETMTPIFSDNIQHVIVNPFWNVPVSITSKEMLPSIQRDPTSLTRANYEVLANVGGRYQIIDPRSVDWNSVDIKRLQIRQRPGDDNALGHVKFMFPNKYSVYLHDTPGRSLFGRDQRALSHGCMRVMDPFAFADALLSEDATLTGAKIKKLVGGSEQQMNMSKHVPVHITYFTATVDDSGKLEVRNDLYGHSAKVRKSLGL